MSGLNVNCFGECLNSHEEEGDNPQIFKNRKGRKCLTLVRGKKALLNANNTQPNQSTLIEITQQPQSRHFVVPLQKQQISLNKSVIIHQSRPVYHPHIIYGRYSAGPSVPISTHRYFLPQKIQINRTRRVSSNHSGSLEQTRSQIEERSASLSISKAEQQKVPQNNITSLPTHNNNNFISVIREQSQLQKRSSLFQGAKSILSKLASSHKNTQKREIQPPAPQTVQKTSNFQIRNFYDNARLCETQHAINHTHSTIKTENCEEVSQLHLSRELSIDDIPMSPKSKTLPKYKDIRMGKLLGVGKWAHVYMCQQVKTNLVFSLKEIFKQSLQYPVTVQRIYHNLQQTMNISHPKIVSVYQKIETNDKICIVSQYCNKSIYEELKTKDHFSISQIKSYAADIVEGLVYLHENDCIHGNLNIFSTFLTFSQCKIKPNFIQLQDSPKKQDFKSDITSLAIIIHEMAYGISPAVMSHQTLYEKQKCYKEKQMRKQLVSSIKAHIQEQNSNLQLSQLNNFIRMLLNWSQELRLTSGVCLQHPFLRGQNV